MLYLAGQILVFVAVALVIGVLLAWVFLIGPMRRQSEEARRALAAGYVGLGAAQPPVADDRAGSAAVVPGAAMPGAAMASAAMASAEVDEGGTAGRDTTADAAVLVTELSVRLRRQDDEWALEKAALTARLSAAEQRAADSEQRVAAVERQVLAAGRRVRTIEGALADAEAHGRANRQTSMPVRAVPVARAALHAGGSSAGFWDGPLDGPLDGPSDGADTGERSGLVAVVAAQANGHADGRAAETLAAEAAQLRVQLAEAEGRAAKFSSRLAMVRTEAEDAQRQVATMTTRLDRHQAEWAAEKVRLLARIGPTEHSVNGADPGNTPDGREDVPVDTDAAGTVLAHERDRDRDGEGYVSVDSGCADDFVFDGKDPALADVVPVRTARPVPGELSDQSHGRLPGSVALAQLTASGGFGSFSVLMPTADTAARRDNLKEIVGIGPVVEARLYAFGIASFRQLAELDEDGVDSLVRVLDGFGDRLVSDDWVGQARSLYERHHGNVA
ncbi:hypothetical protein [Frankia sp. Cas3]|uniref:hypothetical protein n=1 Tax=Frankia sp. Cas3 TaxID=3073926 RepID=UPI002AD3BCE1|nr:hypothetical protein [Frankia sp. Cas3]